MTRPTPIHGLTSAECQVLAEAALPRGAGHCRALYRQAIHQGRFEPESLGIGRYADIWRNTFSLSLPKLDQQLAETDDQGRCTSKLILRSADDLRFESVHLPMGRERHTLCLSTQIGCKMACAFCETGRMGLIRHLTAHEIVAQPLLARQRLGLPVRNLVFMGMGEPLDNQDALFQAIRVFTDPVGFGLSAERLTVCTVGHVDGIHALREQGWKRLNLSLSLNSADPAIRAEIMPVTRRWGLPQLQEALAAYPQRASFVLAINVCLMPGINDRRQDAQLIADFCKPLGRVLVNLIPYNPGREPLTRAPEEPEIVDYVYRLRAVGLPVRRRITKGRSVMAACGQLGGKVAG
jgi:23S rRNA (adenine2503-C2)-methyltransferase